MRDGNAVSPVNEIRKSPTEQRVMPYPTYCERVAAGFDTEIVDLRALPPLDDALTIAAGRQTHRALVVNEVPAPYSRQLEEAARPSADAARHLVTRAA